MILTPTIDDNTGLYEDAYVSFSLGGDELRVRIEATILDCVVGEVYFEQTLIEVDYEIGKGVL